MSEKYRRQKTEEELRDEMIERGEMDEDGNLIENNQVQQENEEGNKPDLSAEQIDWKKRHDDGRRFQIQLQSRNKELEQRLADVEKQLSEKVSVPDNLEEFEEWVKEFPKVADMVKIAARQELASLDKSIEEKLKKVDKLDSDSRMREEREKLAKLQPDFYTEIARSEEFKDWILNVADDWAREAVFDEKNPNAALVSTVIDSFKVRTGYGKKNKTTTKTTSDDAASSVRTGKSSAPKEGKTKKWSESSVDKLSIHEYEKYEEEINQAIMDGTFEYDMRDAQ